MYNLIHQLNIQSGKNIKFGQNKSSSSQDIERKLILVQIAEKNDV